MDWPGGDEVTFWLFNEAVSDAFANQMNNSLHDVCKEVVTIARFENK